MKKVKITVLRATFNEDLAREYGMPGLTACPAMKEGQVFYAGAGKPDGLCDGAWRSIHQYVFALANGARQFWFDDWIRRPGVAIACCNDGLRPVFFKLEATDEEAESPFI
ncbi:TIGR04076 family protein [uncultured Alistipes sp.]|uniref:TIGR04076 family protein n=1 Tax=uncultured Alistipes sp. TaxID=538949 RepID=UPI002637A718|nr:TIGR04076 family protein [uncultured Alistipes sp.]